MKSIILYPNFHKPGAREVAQVVKTELQQRHVNVACAVPAPGMLCPKAVDPSTVIATIVIGGDGTVLRLIKEFPTWQFPVLGLNLGTLGFMTDVPLHDIKDALNDLIQGNFTVQQRMMIDVVTKKTCYTALNEAYVHRSNFSNLVQMQVKIDEQWICKINGDGLIIATPNGSTAYSLSAGGPIVMPDLQCYLLTPVCPHTLSNRPLIIHADKTLQVESVDSALDVAIDGVVVEALEPGQSIALKCSKRRFNWLHLNRYNYYQTIRDKLGWHT